MIGRTQEKKYITFNTGGVAVANTGVFAEVTSIPQSTTAASDTTRTGDMITVRSIRLRVQVHVPPAYTDVYNNIRVCVIQWKEGWTVTPADLINQAFEGTTFTINALYSHDRRFRYRVLYDKTKRITDTVSPVMWFKTVITKFQTKRIQFNSGQTTAGNGGSGPIGIGFVTDSTVLPHPIVEGYYRIKWTDS